MASFRKRGPYQWQAQIRKKGQPLQAKTFDTRAEAEQWARQVECEMERGDFMSRTEAESTTLKKGAASEFASIRALLQHPLALRIVGASAASIWLAIAMSVSRRSPLPPSNGISRSSPSLRSGPEGMGHPRA